MSNQYCFACGKLMLDNTKHLVDTKDGQTVYVGPECYKRIVKAGDNGYLPNRYNGRIVEYSIRLFLIGG